MTWDTTVNLLACSYLSNTLSLPISTIVQNCVDRQSVRPVNVSPEGTEAKSRNDF